MQTTTTFAWTPEQVRVLEAMNFDQQPPGTVLRDFETLLGLLGDSGLPLTPAHRFTMQALETINRNLVRPLDLRLQRAAQQSYPHINGLYLLLRASGLSLVDVQSRKPRLRLDERVLDSWRSLNAAERYFTLLKAWWGRASGEIIGERGFLAQDIVLKLVPVIEELAAKGTLTVENPQEADRFRYYPGLYNLALLELFGMVEIRARPPAKGQGWQPEWLRMTDWGRVLLTGYVAFTRQALTREEDAADPLMLDALALFDPLERFEAWSHSLRPHIKGWTRDLDIPGEAFQPGPHQFKVALRAGCWRRIAIPGEASLEELADLILQAFDFDEEHLYSFSYRDRFGRTCVIDHPYSADDFGHASADEVRVGDLPLCEGMAIDFLYDFGDEWLFRIQTERPDVDRSITKPRVLEEHGKAPEQYGGW